MPRSAWAFCFFVCACARTIPTSAPPAASSPSAIHIPAGCEANLTGDWQHVDDPTFRYHFEDDGSDVTVWVYRVFAPPDAGAPSRLFPRILRDGGQPAVRRDAGSADAGPDPRDGGAATSDAGRTARDSGTIAAGADAGQSLSGGTALPLEDAGSETNHHHPLPPDLLPRDGGNPPLATAVIHLRRTPDGFIGEAETLHLLPSGRECRATFPTRIAACGPSTLTLVSAASTPVGDGCQTPALPRPAALLEHRLARTTPGEL